MKKFLLLLLFTPVIVAAQGIDTAFVSLAFHHAKEIHSNRIKGESLLYNGVDYAKYTPLHDEFPYFLLDDWSEGSIYYDDQLYKNTWLLYDISTDNVIIENYNFSTTIQLIKERIQFFTLEGHTFIQVNHASQSPGFYELLYEGETRVLAKHTKNLQEQINSGVLFHVFEEKTRYYIYKDSHYHLVRNKASVLNLLKDHKQELSQQFRKSPYSFNSNRAASIVALAQAYDSIPK